MIKLTNAIVLGVAIIISALIPGNAFINRNKTAVTISVTGLGKADFNPDLIVRKGRFEAVNTNLKQAYLNLENNKRKVESYLMDKGIPPKEACFQIVQQNLY